MLDMLLTEPNEKRQLYFDITIGIQGFEKPTTVLGTDIIKFIFHNGIKNLLGLLYPRRYKRWRCRWFRRKTNTQFIQYDDSN